MTPAPPSPEPRLRSLVGRTLVGRYELTRWLGGGAFGGVFEGRQLILGQPVRRVACKLSRRTGMTEESAAEIFADALRLAEALDGMTDAEARRHLVHVYDGGVAPSMASRAYLVMEYVPGDSTLATWFGSLQPVPANQMFGWAGQACLALRGLHSLDPPLLHRDIKPDNVLLGSDRMVRLIDFGLAARLLTTGAVPGVAGTLQYMAPETSQGRSVPASDLYSLGVLLYEGLTGGHPFEHLKPPRDLPESMHGDWLHGEKRLAVPVPPSRLTNTVGQEADEVVLRCLEFEPERRFQSAVELLAALDSLRDGTSAARRPAGERALEEAEALLEADDPDGARRVLVRFERGEWPLSTGWLLLTRRMADVLAARGRPAEAAERLDAVWHLVRERALLRTRKERRDLLDRIAALYRTAGMTFQANQFAWLSEREGGRR
ncbi:serine/threonine-protein kinase [Streptomyces sp. TS71-3]|uniref:serine/threonine-protein kinase n=1 Tax=Streptomyces sp. TS71-3 TaxID=2733862 RepID=UPI001B0CE32D|nr:serine/threonine-protein kinase [Streptomyces sp. TS71-3]GHJ42014.1 hypothetical protein Sm713_76230 [Streptomyces sp. TS71-3]